MGTVLNAPAAVASGGVCNPGCSANVEFESYGEILTVHDYSADGLSAVAEFDTHRDGSISYFINSNGYDAPPKVFNLDLPEGTLVRYRACLTNSGSGIYTNCSGWYNDVA
ncbi:hypothetical protein ABZX69_44760 [Streptomyces sp. NPDC004074]|uniref:hypothetical protein n=1 Tax=unclassified Streptomyces TaxID=2593676 RepID=UPI0033BF896C